jgi:hypothetical protein
MGQLGKVFDPLSTAPYEAQAGLAKLPANILPLRAAVRKEPRQRFGSIRAPTTS